MGKSTEVAETTATLADDIFTAVQSASDDEAADAKGLVAEQIQKAINAKVNTYKGQVTKAKDRVAELESQLGKLAGNQTGASRPAQSNDDKVAVVMLRAVRNPYSKSDNHDALVMPVGSVQRLTEFDAKLWAEKGLVRLASNGELATQMAADIVASEGQEAEPENGSVDTGGNE